MSCDAIAGAVKENCFSAKGDTEMKRMLAMILALALVLTWMPALSQEAHAEEIASGGCGAAGDHLTWTLNEGGTLTISGTGAMSDYRSDGTAPWYDYRESVKSVVIENGAASIGNYAFYQCTSLTSVVIR